MLARDFDSDVVRLDHRIARTPGASLSSSAASWVIRATNRCCPACTSTSAATLSLVTRVTMPAKRLRADWVRAPVRGGSPAISTAKRAKSAPLTNRRPPARSVVFTLPASAQRRTVSGLTPRISAASPMRYSMKTSR